VVTDGLGMGIGDLLLRSVAERLQVLVEGENAFVARFDADGFAPGAWEDGQVTVSYQPLVRLDPAAADTGQIVALAALLRWEHPQRSAVAHDDCLALAEKTGLVLSIGPWMLRQWCAPPWPTWCH
jgi:EAL domain-containing protein (putative c-di-GMP-specific phosphodiesterase class I)